MRRSTEKICSADAGKIRKAKLETQGCQNRLLAAQGGKFKRKNMNLGRYKILKRKIRIWERRNSPPLRMHSTEQ